MGRKFAKDSRARLLAIDCFAGCGGMTEGFKQAGFSVVGAIENDSKACKVYKLNHPEVQLWEKDIHSVTSTRILRTLGLKKGELHLLGGCPPCQGFSTLRTYNGGRRVHDVQNDLIFEFQRLILSLLPKNVMMENVPGLHDNRRFTEFRSALERAGYRVRGQVLNVNDYGVPQRRRRLVVLASRVADVNFATADQTRLTVRQAIGKLPAVGKSGDAVHDLPEKRSATVKQIIASIPKDGGSRSALPKQLVLACHKKSNGFKDIYGRMAWNKPAPTITTGCFNPSKGRFLHPDANRAITIREAALLQSFPQTYKFPAEIGKVRLATMIGNALPPQFIKRHAEVLMQADFQA